MYCLGSRLYSVIGRSRNAVKMINFLNSKLSPKVSSSASSMDNYDVENLINENDLIRARGFLAFSSIKPPIDIDFELICPISIAYVFIVTAVGSQKCNGIEILAKTHSNEYTSIAKAFFTEKSLIACNSRLFSRLIPPPGFNENCHLCFFKSNTFRTFTNASKIRIRILRTENSVPCLGKVEIWGRVSKMCSEVTAKTIQQIIERQQGIPNARNKSTAPPDSNTSAKAFQVPDEFKDALTYEIMAIPMTLPSGSTVDKSTLEKYVENEASLGRHPGDPFTGLKFTDTRKPVLNVALKSRIDMFLLLHSDKSEVFSVKRTLGSTKNIKQIECVGTSNSSKRNNNADFTELQNIKKCKTSDDDDLNRIISETINANNFVSFTSNDGNNKRNVDNSPVCVICSSHNLLYVLPCKHLYCRTCLLKICSELKCSKCYIPFERLQPKKFHFG